MKNQIRVMLCDDSAVMRRLLKSALESDAGIKVVCEAKHGQDALDRLKLDEIDIVIVDVEMPVMDGIDAVRGIRKRSTTLPLIMFSSLTSRGAEATLDAIAAGANDFATKPTGAGHINDAMEQVRQELIPKVYHWAGKTPAVAQARSLAPVASIPAGNPTRGQEITTPPQPSFLTSGERVHAIAVGVSTGGPQALATLVAELPLKFSVPILIAQHMPPVFTGLLADRLAALKGHTVREALDGEELRPGVVLIAPGDHHLTARRDRAAVRVRLNQDPPENSCRPAVDPLFRSMADCYGHQALGVVLTGMGTDGTDGSQTLKKKGARVIVQDEQSSVIWGMPGNIVRHGLADRVLPINQIAMEMTRLTEQKAPSLA